jgi:hypothetical protein
MKQFGARCGFASEDERGADSRSRPSTTQTEDRNQLLSI